MISIIFGINNFYIYFVAQNDEFMSYVFREIQNEFQTHGCRERKILHRERFAKDMTKGKTE